MNPVKPLAALGVGGSAMAGAYFTSDYWIPSSEKITVKKSISQILTDNKYAPLDVSKTSEWDAVLSKYNQTYPSSRKEVTQIKTYCQDLLSKREFSSNDYKEARRWCVEGQSITKRLGLFGKKSLSLENSPDADDEAWKLKISSHKLQTSTNKLDHTFGAVDSENITAIKGKCRDLSTKTNIDETFEDDFSKSLDWCAIDSSNPRIQ